MSGAVLDPIHDDLEAYVLGALDRDEEEHFSVHLRDCAACRDGVVSYVPVTSALRSLPVAPAPPMPVVDLPEPRRLHSPRFVPAAYAAAAAIVLVLAAAAYAFMRPNSDQQLVAVAGMMADGPRQAQIIGEGVRGRVIIGRRNVRAAVVLRGLPPPPAGSAYHVWIMNSKPVLVGALTPARDDLEVLLTDANMFASGHILRVSLESTNSTAPSSSPALASGTY